MKSKKAIFILDINYEDKIKKITKPLIEQYAEKIGADLIVLNQIKFPDYSIEVEKFQIYNYRNNYEWFIYIDLDALIHPDTPDFTELIKKDQVLFGDVNFCGNTYKLNEWFRRDGRFIDAGNWFNICSDITIDLWFPYFKYSQSEAESMISPTSKELKLGITKSHLVDGYLISCNIARYGLKLETVSDILQKLRIEKDVYFYHNYELSIEQKVNQLANILARWK